MKNESIHASPAARVTLVMSALFGTTSVILVFLSRWLEGARGLTGAEIGAVLSLSQFARVLTGPAIAAWADHVSDRRLPLRIVSLAAICAYAALTLHRPSNVDEREKLTALFGVLEEIHRELPVVFPVHPRTRAAIERLLGGRGPALRTCEPLGYLDFLRLMSDARLVLTDSGGIQEETTVLGVPCLTLRENTERPITVTEGTNLVVGTDPERVKAEAKKILDGHGKKGGCPDLWDGRTAERIAELYERVLGA